MAELVNVIPYFFLLLASTAWSASTEFIFNGFHGAENLTLDGAANVTAEGLLQLTKFTHGEIGHAFYSYQVKMLVMNNSFASKPTPVSFSTSFVFQIDANKSAGSEGFAFVVAPSTKLRASKFRFLGLFWKRNNGNFSNHLFAVEFDTYQNSDHDNSYSEMPRNHVGVDINSIVSNFSEPAAYHQNGSSNVSLDLQGGEPIQAWIDYSGETKVLNVTISPLNFTSKPQIPLISRMVDLSSVFKEYMYVGFSSSTGQRFASSHYILGWSFSTNGSAPPLNVPQLPHLQGPRPPSATSTTSPFEVGGIAAAATLVLLVLAALVIWYLCRRRNHSDRIEVWELEYPRRLSYKDLHSATKGFNSAEILGSGGFGKVYKGVLPSTGEEVAIKKFSSKSSQGQQEFLAEIASLGRMRHRHLVQLHGWCKKNADLLLIYEFMPNGSLDQLLFNKEKGSLLSWDADMNGKLSDFGLAKLYAHGQSPHVTRIVGTFGYMAPELTFAGQATAGSDVYSYGVLLLEVACGQKPIELSDSGKESVLLERVREYRRRGHLLQAVDPRLGGCYVREEVDMVLSLGLHCCQYDAELRPTMRQITRYLNGDDKLGDDASLVFADVDSFDVASGPLYSSTSYGNMSTSGSFPGRGKSIASAE